MPCKKVQIQRTVTINEITCDVCGADTDELHICAFCQRYLCCRCWCYRSEGGLELTFCRACWKMGEEYRKRIAVLEAEEDDQRELWKNACVAARERGE